MANIQYLNAYKVLYGEQAFRDLQQFGVVMEHINEPVFVGGTYWQDPKRRVRPVYSGPPISSQEAMEKALSVEERLVALEKTVAAIKEGGV